MAKQILIAYFSRTGNTRIIANHICDDVGGTIYEIQPETPYSSEYNAVVEQAKKEVQAGYKPAIKPEEKTGDADVKFELLDR